MIKVYGLLSYVCGSAAIALFAVALLAGGGQVARADLGGTEDGGYTCTDESLTKTCHCVMLASGPDIGSACETNATSGCKETECTCRRTTPEDGVYCGRQARPAGGGG